MSRLVYFYLFQKFPRIEDEPYSLLNLMNLKKNNTYFASSMNSVLLCRVEVSIDMLCTL